MGILALYFPAGLDIGELSGLPKTGFERKAWGRRSEGEYQTAGRGEI